MAGGQCLVTFSSHPSHHPPTPRHIYCGNDSYRPRRYRFNSLLQFLGTTIANTLKWDINAEIIAKEAQQRMFILRQLKMFRVNKTILTQGH